MSDSVRPHRRWPIRLPCPWDSPGKNTAVGCHFLLQCMKVKSESEVSQSCPTPATPMDCSPPGSSIHGIVQAIVLEWGAIAFSVSPNHAPALDAWRVPTQTDDQRWVSQTVSLPEVSLPDGGTEGVGFTEPPSARAGAPALISGKGPHVILQVLLSTLQPSWVAQRQNRLPGGPCF